jgi:hypothetical protein
MGYRAFKERGIRAQIAIAVSPGLVLLVAGLLWIGGWVVGIGALLIVLALLILPLIDADDGASG